ncbi:MAG: hypothetical protein KIS66_15515 [Fimbriimonadaceae bacterium]|nr:hypothetical protein [Fimbriimonadaceae bacterium]
MTRRERLLRQRYLGLYKDYAVRTRIALAALAALMVPNALAQTGDWDRERSEVAKMVTQANGRPLSGSAALRLKALLQRPDSSRDWVHEAFSKVAPGRMFGEANEVPNLDTVGALDALRVASGEYQGAFLTAPYGYINWYFASLALYHFVEQRPAESKGHVDAFLFHTLNDGTILDVVPDWWNANNGVPIYLEPDSHDSYASTVLALAGKVYLHTGDANWFQSRLPRLKYVLRKNILDSQNPQTGLVRVFQNPALPSWSPGVEYLMDNCEVYQGLDTFGRALQNLGDAYAGTVLAARDKLAQGIRTKMFRDAAGAWAHAAQATNVGAGFYPYSTAQAFPVAFEVPVTAAQAEAGWDYMKETTEQYWKAGRYDSFPWLVLAYGSALRGEREMAIAQLNSAFKYVRANPQFLTINELGFWHATVKRL